MRVVGHWSRFPREDLNGNPLKVFKVSSEQPSGMEGGLGLDKVPSNANNSIIILNFLCVSQIMFVTESFFFCVSELEFLPFSYINF